MGTVSAFILLASGACEFGQRDRRAQFEIDMLKNAGRAFEKAIGRPPKDLNEMAPPMCPDGGCMVARPIPDVWGNPYRTEIVGGHLRFISSGPDRVFGNADDLTSEND